MQNNIPRRCEDVDNMLVPQRPLLSDVRYVHLLDLARRVDTTDIITMKRGRERQKPDLELPYHPPLLKMLQASCHKCMLEFQRSDSATSCNSVQCTLCKLFAGSGSWAVVLSPAANGAASQPSFLQLPKNPSSHASVVQCSTRHTVLQAAAHGQPCHTLLF